MCFVAWRPDQRGSCGASARHTRAHYINRRSGWHRGTRESATAASLHWTPVMVASPPSNTICTSFVFGYGTTASGAACAGAVMSADEHGRGGQDAAPLVELETGRRSRAGRRRSAPHRARASSHAANTEPARSSSAAAPNRAVPVTAASGFTIETTIRLVVRARVAKADPAACRCRRSRALRCSCVQLGREARVRCCRRGRCSPRGPRSRGFGASQFAANEHLIEQTRLEVPALVSVTAGGVPARSERRELVARSIQGAVVLRPCEVVTNTRSPMRSRSSRSASVVEADRRGQGGAAAGGDGNGNVQGPGGPRGYSSAPMAALATSCSARSCRSSRPTIAWRTAREPGARRPLDGGGQSFSSGSGTRAGSVPSGCSARGCSAGSRRRAAAPPGRSTRGSRCRVGATRGRSTRR